MVFCPVTVRPTVNGSTNSRPNQVANWLWSVRARQTRCLGRAKDGGFLDAVLRMFLSSLS
jgi:hypothetical protein